MKFAENSKLFILIPILVMFLAVFVSAGDTDNNGLEESTSVPLTVLEIQDYPIVLDTGDVIHTIPTPGQSCQGITWDGEYLWVSDNYSGDIFKISPVDGSVQFSFDGPGEYHEGLAWDGTFLWAAANGGSNSEPDYLYGINPENGEVVHSFTMPTSWVHGITIANGYLWGNDFSTDMIYKMDLPGLEILDSIPSPGNATIGLTWDGLYLWTDDFQTALLYQINPYNGEVIRTVPAPFSNCRDLTWDGEYLWTVTWQTDLCYQVDVGGAPTSVGTGNRLPQSFSLSGNYPNPFNASTTITFELNTGSFVNLDIYDQLGRHIRTLINCEYTAGNHSIVWDGQANNGEMISSGVYYYRLNANGISLTDEMLLIK